MSLEPILEGADRMSVGRLFHTAGPVPQWEPDAEHLMGG